MNDIQRRSKELREASAAWSKSVAEKKAANFLRNLQGDFAYTPEFQALDRAGVPVIPALALVISSALHDYAYRVRGCTWRSRRSELRRFFEEKGSMVAAAIIAAAVNPVEPAQRKGSANRIRRVTSQDATDLLVGAAGLRDDGETLAAVTLGLTTGMRPSEMTKAQLLPDGRVLIFGSKKRLNKQGNGLNRGRNRTVNIPQGWEDRVRRALDKLSGKTPKDLDAIAARLRRLGRRLWPDIKAVPSLYSLRHQVASDLKAQGGDSFVIAAQLGHRDGITAPRYGNARAGGGLVTNIVVDDEMIAQVPNTKVRNVEEAIVAAWKGNVDHEEVSISLG